MDEVKAIVSDFQKKLLSLGFSAEEISTILYEVVLIAAAGLSQQDLSFLSKEELEFVSNRDLMQLTPEQLRDVTVMTPNLVRYMSIYAQELRKAIKEFDNIVEDVKQEEAAGTLPQGND